MTIGKHGTEIARNDKQADWASQTAKAAGVEAASVLAAYAGSRATNLDKPSAS